MKEQKQTVAYCRTNLTGDSSAKTQLEIEFQKALINFAYEVLTAFSTYDSGRRSESIKRGLRRRKATLEEQKSKQQKQKVPNKKK